MSTFRVWPLLSSALREDGRPYSPGEWVAPTAYVQKQLARNEVTRQDPTGSAPDAPVNLSGVRSIASGQWVTAPTICRLSISGTGTLRVDGRSRSGVVTQGLAQGRYVSASGAMQVVYADAAVEIRAVITGALTVEVLA